MERVAEFDAARRRDFQRMLGWSFAAHVIAVVLSLASPPTRVGSPPAVVAVELVASVPGQTPAPPKPKPAPPAAKPEPPPPPAPPKPKQVVLPKNPVQEPKPKPEAKPKPAKPEPRREVVVAPKPKEEKSLEDLLADMREEHGEPTAAPAPAPAPTTAAVTGPVPSAGTGTMSPEEADWRRRAKLHVRQAWVVPPGFRTEPLETHVSVRLDAAGNLVGAPSIERHSGNPWYDEGVIHGIEKASPLPAPPEAGTWLFVFVPEDAY